MNRLTFRLYLLFMASWLLHLPARLPALSVLRIDLLLVCAIVALIMASSTAASVPRVGARTNRLVLVVISYAILSAPFVQWPGTVLKTGLPEYVKALVFYYFTAKLLTTEPRLDRLLLVFVVCQTFRVLEPVYLHVTQGYWGSAASMSGSEEMMDRLSGAPSDIVNPNGLAFVVVTIVPFMHYLWTRTRLGAVAYVLLLPPLLYALTLTGSRSGMVALAITFLAIWMGSRRKLVLAAVATAAMCVAIPLLSADLRDRYLSIVDSDTKNAQTAQDRVEGTQADFAVAMRRPLLGYGLGTSREANAHFGGRDLPSHNLITQVLQELGIVGSTIFFLLLVCIYSDVRGALRHFSQVSAPSALLLRLSRVLHVWLLMNIFFSFFSYGLSSYEWYFIAGLAQVVTLLSTRLNPTTLATTSSRPVQPASAGSSPPLRGAPEWAAGYR